MRRDRTALKREIAGLRLRSMWKMRTPLLPTTLYTGLGHLQRTTVRLFSEGTHGTNRGAFGDLIPLESQKNLDAHDLSEIFRLYPPPPRLPALLALAATRCLPEQTRHHSMHNAPLGPVQARCVAVRRWPSQPS
jgi:hypothetical protein